MTEGAAAKKITVIVNKSRTINVGKPFARAVVGSADYADVLPLSASAIYIQGKKPGTTNVSLFDSEGRLIGVLDLEVTLDTRNVEAKIGTRGVRVSSVQGQVVLSGTAVDAVAADRAVQVAQSLAGGQPVVNAMQVAPAQQVMLEVRFLEASRDASRELGVNWNLGANGKTFVSTGRGTAAVTNNNNPGGPVSGVPVVATAGTLVGASGLGGPFGTVLSRVLNQNGTKNRRLVTALEEKGVVRRLAEPNLIALSGDRIWIRSKSLEGNANLFHLNSGSAPHLGGVEVDGQGQPHDGCSDHPVEAVADVAGGAITQHSRAIMIQWEPKQRIKVAPIGLHHCPNSSQYSDSAASRGAITW